jgi:hypothetical protein
MLVVVGPSRRAFPVDNTLNIIPICPRIKICCPAPAGHAIVQVRFKDAADNTWTIYFDEII